MKRSNMHSPGKIAIERCYTVTCARCKIRRSIHTQSMGKAKQWFLEREWQDTENYGWLCDSCVKEQY
jgi:hypothetical protein